MENDITIGHKRFQLQKKKNVTIEENTEKITNRITNKTGK